MSGEREEMQDDALAFAAWLTSRPGVLTVGSGEECGPLAEAVAEWRKANPLRAPASEGEAVAWAVVDGNNAPLSAALSRSDADYERREWAVNAATAKPVTVKPLFTHPAPATVTRTEWEISHGKAKRSARVAFSEEERDRVVAYLRDQVGAHGIRVMERVVCPERLISERDVTAALGGAR